MTMFKGINITHTCNALQDRDLREATPLSFNVSSVRYEQPVTEELVGRHSLVIAVFIKHIIHRFLNEYQGAICVLLTGMF